MKLKPLITLVVAGAFAVPIAASASDVTTNPANNAKGPMQPPVTTAPHGLPPFAQIDANHDKYISRDEARNAQGMDTRFSELDRDNDGRLSPEEFAGAGAGERSATGGSAAGSESSVQPEINLEPPNAPTPYKQR